MSHVLFCKKGKKQPEFFCASFFHVNNKWSNELRDTRDILEQEDKPNKRWLFFNSLNTVSDISHYWIRALSPQPHENG